jgi:hypothetical protein
MDETISAQTQSIVELMIATAQELGYGPDGNQRCNFIGLNPKRLEGTTVDELLAALPGWRAQVVVAEDFPSEVVDNVPPETLNAVMFFPPKD